MLKWLGFKKNKHEKHEKPNLKNIEKFSTQTDTQDLCFISIDINLIVCLFVTTNLCCLKSERHETQHVRPLDMRESLRSYTLNFDLKVLF